MNLIRSIINFFGFNDAIVDGIGERGMRDSSIIRYNEVHDMYDKIIKDLGDMSAYVSKGYDLSVNTSVFRQGMIA